MKFDNDYWHGYRVAARTIQHNVKYTGWARAKGDLKKTISTILKDETNIAFFWNLETSRGFMDGICDSVN